MEEAASGDESSSAPGSFDFSDEEKGPAAMGEAIASGHQGN